MSIFSLGLETTEKKNPVESRRYYHGRLHAEIVLREVERLGHLAKANGKLYDRDIERLMVAAAWHDPEQALGPGENEEESARLASKAMKELFNYDDEEVYRVMELIRGTKIHFDMNGVMHQEAEKMGYVAQLLADADLSSLGAAEPEFVEMSTRLMREFAGKSELTAEELKLGWRNQVKFMTGRKYLTEEGRALYEEQYEKNLHLATELSRDTL